MTRPVIFHELAERELDDAASYYHAQKRPGLVAAFVAEVERVLRLISATPLGGSLGRGDIRRWRLRRFPYSLVYRMTSDNVRILAVAPHKRRPSYWQGRT